MPIRSVFLATALAIAPVAANATDFVPGTEDVPVMAGLKAESDSAIVFDKPQGRIVQARFHGRLARGEVETFYTATLPQLGWQPAGDDRWQREDEILRLDFSGADGDVGVDCSLSPR
jgi:hypothetical protein